MLNIVKIFKDERKKKEIEKPPITERPWTILEVYASLEEAQKKSNELVRNVFSGQSVLIKANRVSGKPITYSVGIM